jgi:UDP-N-acetylglucosamine:LPS N-acetylglucosamine transferase
VSAAASEQAAPRALLVTSAGAPGAAVVPVLAALEAGGLQVRAIDAGRVGSRGDGLVEGVFRAIAGEFAERRLLRELQGNPPDAIVAFEPGSIQVLGVARDESPVPAVVVAVVAELDPDEAWGATDADRYLVCDDEAAVTLADHGIQSDRIMVVGAVGEHAFAEAGRQGRGELRGRFKIASSAPVVVVEVGGLGDETVSQMALQLSLVERECVYLFDAGSDSDAAAILRRQVPALGLRAKLFGESEDRARYWRCADVVVARPRPASVARTVAVGARMVALAPEGKDGERLARALDGRGLGATAASPLLVSSAIDGLLGRGARSDDLIGADGARAVADVVWIAGGDRRGVIAETRSVAHARTRERVRAAASAADAATRASAPPGDLEDLSGGGFSGADEVELPDDAEIAGLRAALSTRMKQVSRSVLEARESAESWEKKAERAKGEGDADAAAAARKQADAERARMHEHLKEMAELESEMRSLEKAERAAREAPPRPGPTAGAGPTTRTRSRPKPPPRASGPSVDELLDRLKNEARTGGGTSTRAAASGKRASRPTPTTTVDDELAALKRKMAAKKNKP